MKKIFLQVVTPERVILEMESDSLSVPTPSGQMTILPNHMPLVSVVTPGELIVKNGNKQEFVSVSGGFLEIKRKSQALLLADAAEHYYEINLKRAQAAKERAQELLKNKQLNAQEYATTFMSLEKSLARINLVKKHSHRRKSGITGEGVLEE